MAKTLHVVCRAMGRSWLYEAGIFSYCTDDTFTSSKGQTCSWYQLMPVGYRREPSTNILVAGWGKGEDCPSPAPYRALTSPGHALRTPTVGRVSVAECQASQTQGDAEKVPASWLCVLPPIDASNELLN